jgi:uncharacterized membrane protein YkoI
MKPITKAAALAAVLALAAVTQGAAQRPAYRREVPPRLLRLAKVSEDSALTVAGARFSGVANRQVQGVELENENGTLIWSWEFKFPGMPGVYECNVSALDGSVVGVEHELPRDSTPRATPQPKPERRRSGRLSPGRRTP